MAIMHTIRTGYRIGPFALDFRSGDLSRNGRPIRLQEKPRSVLLALAARPGELISRAELHELLWPGDTFVDFEDGLNAAMSKLREALGDDIQSPRYIETVRGRGYRFIARIELDSIAEQTPIRRPGQATPPSFAAGRETAGLPEPALQRTAPADTRRRAMVVSIVLACLAAGTIAALGWRSAHPARISVAVLPFANMTGDASRDYICNGITEELIAQLQHLAPNQLRVIAPSSAQAYANSKKPGQQIARELQVQYLIQGSLQQQGADIRVAAQLVRAQDQSPLWADVYEGDLSDQFEFEASVAESVEHALSLRVPSIAHNGRGAGIYEAHDAYLKGLYYLSQRSKQGFEQAIDSFADAVALDPHYAAAYARLAATYNLMGQYTWMNPPNARSQAWAAAEQALSLDPSEAEAHAALGFSLWFYKWDAVAAESELRKAIALDPESVDAHHWYAQLLMTAGRYPEAERQMQAALDVDPRSPILRTNLGWLYYYERRFPLAIEQIQSVISENPEFVTAHYKLWYTYSAMGDEPRAWQEFQWVVHSTTDAAHQSSIIKAYKESGYKGALKELADQDDSEYYGSMVDGARCMIFAGDRDGALRELMRAYEQREGWFIYAASDPAFSPLWKDARFQKTMMRLRASFSQ